MNPELKRFLEGMLCGIGLTLAVAGRPTGWFMLGLGLLFALGKS